MVELGYVEHMVFRPVGRPRPQPRPRARIVEGGSRDDRDKVLSMCGSFAKGGYATTKRIPDRVRMYTPKGTTQGWKAAVTAAARPLYHGVTLDEPLVMVLNFFMPRPKTHFRTGKYAALLKDSAPTHHLQGRGVGGGDADNLEKPVFDALKVLGLYKDDGLISDWWGSKRWTLQGQRPGALITIGITRPEGITTVTVEGGSIHA